MNEIESAKAPHSARFVWKTMIHAVSPAIHTAAPIADITTSKYEKVNIYLEIHNNNSAMCSYNIICTYIV